MPVAPSISIRRTLGEGDAEGIVALHDRVYRAEYERNDAFVAAVARKLVSARAAGWPDAGGAVWLVEYDGVVAGSLGLTDEGDGVGCVRWVVLAPELRGRGLMRGLIAELLAEARASGFERLELGTFSALRSAARIYRDAGFAVTWERERDDWGPPITYQHYELSLGRADPQARTLESDARPAQRPKLASPDPQG
jgi:GNAT superfamily N-acetyltransferase